MSYSDIPKVTDLISDESCLTCTKKPKIGKFKPDRRLNNFEEWIRRRKELHKKLGTLLKRDPGNLLMNASDEFRAVCEQKLTMAYAEIPEPDRQRGCPSFWKVGQKLKTFEDVPSVYGMVPKTEKCVVPNIEWVNVPQAILKEKEILPRDRNMLLCRNKSIYLKERQEQFKNKLDRIAPQKPSDELIIIGKAIFPQTDVITDKLELPEDHNKQIRIENLPEKVSEKKSVLSLSVNEIPFNLNLPFLGGIRKVYVFYDYDVSNPTLSTQYLYLKNQGTTTIRLSWKKFKPIKYFKDTVVQFENGPHFYFNKNESLIMPGTSIEYPIWFLAYKIGVYTEYWELITKPCVTPQNVKIVICLHASASIVNLSEKMENITNILDNRIRNRLIKESLSFVLESVPYDKRKPIIYSYNKKDVFEAVNSQVNAFCNQPTHMYNKEIVRELQSIYRIVRRKNDPKCWNYKIDELELLIESKVRSLERTDDLQISSHGKTRESLKSEKQNLRKEAFYEPKQLSKRFNDAVAKLKTPCVIINETQEQHEQVYIILCNYFDNIEREIEDLREKMEITSKCVYPKNTKTQLYRIPDRLVLEKFEDVLQGPKLVEPVGDIMDKPADEALQAIPMGDYASRYSVYYLGNASNQSAVTDKKGDKGGGKKNDEKKSGKSGSKLSKPDAPNESDEDEGQVIDKYFNPYAMVFHSESLDKLSEATIDSKHQSETTILENFSDKILWLFKINCYFIVYKNLQSAIMDIVDVIEMYSPKPINYLLVKEIHEKDYNRRLIDLKGLLAEEVIQTSGAKAVIDNYRKRCSKDWKTLEFQKQLKSVQSDSSIWSILKPYKVQSEQHLFEGFKPIAYPEEIYAEDIEKHSKLTTDQTKIYFPVSTSTSNPEIDPDWEDYKEIAIQKDYFTDDEPDDLEAYVEKVTSEISVQELALHNSESTVCERDSISEEYQFYSDSEESIVSLRSDEEGCVCEKFFGDAFRLSDEQRQQKQKKKHERVSFTFNNGTDVD